MRFKTYSVLIAAALAFSSCGKEFLEEKRDARELIVRNINDYQAVLDNQTIVNTFSSVSLALMSAGEFTLPDNVLTTWKVNMPYEINGYLWEKDIFNALESTDWNNSWQRVMLANLALDVQKLTPANATEQAFLNNTKGSAHFIRAFSFYQLAQLFIKPYDEATATTDIGLPLRTDYDVTVKYPQSTVAETYKFIIKDLEDAMPLLPATALNVNRPSKAAAATLLARVYMQMGNWDKVLEYANQALTIKSTLADFKAPGSWLTATQFVADFGKTYPEMIWYSQIHKPSSTYTGMAASADVLSLYEGDDLRRTIFFTKLPTDSSFKGSLGGLYTIFAGYTTSEVYLIRAEAYARKGQADLAMADVNELRRNRFPAGTPALTITDANDALKYIIDERRRELYMRGTRWEDLRRLNKEPQFATTLTHTYQGKTYELKPNTDRYVMPLPDNEIQINNYPQNPR